MAGPFFTLCAVVAVVVTAHNAAWAFIAPILAAKGISGTAFAVELFVYGVAGALTTAYASRHLDAHPTRVTMLALGCMVVALLALTFSPAAAVAAFAAAAWGGAFGVLPVAFQTRALSMTPGFTDASTPIYVVAFQVGISLGALVGSALITHVDATTLPLFAAIVTALAASALAQQHRPESSRP